MTRMTQLSEESTAPGAARRRGLGRARGRRPGADPGAAGQAPPAGRGLADGGLGRRGPARHAAVGPAWSSSPDCWASGCARPAGAVSRGRPDAPGAAPAAPDDPRMAPGPPARHRRVRLAAAGRGHRRHRGGRGRAAASSSPGCRTAIISRCSKSPRAAGNGSGGGGQAPSRHGNRDAHAPAGQWPAQPQATPSPSPSCSPPRRQEGLVQPVPGGLQPAGGARARPRTPSPSVSPSPTPTPSPSSTPAQHRSLAHARVRPR